MRIALASDHAGFSLKGEISEVLSGPAHDDEGFSGPTAPSPQTCRTMSAQVRWLGAGQG